MSQDFTKITALKAVHVSGLVLELSFTKITLTKAERVAVIPIETYPVTNKKDTEQKWAADVFLSTLESWKVAENVIPMSAEEINSLGKIVNEALMFWNMPHKIM